MLQFSRAREFETTSPGTPLVTSCVLGPGQKSSPNDKIKVLLHFRTISSFNFGPKKERRIGNQACFRAIESVKKNQACEAPGYQGRGRARRVVPSQNGNAAGYVRWFLICLLPECKDMPFKTFASLSPIGNKPGRLS
jgi:hypothetical protein